MEKVVLKRPMWDGRVLHPAGMAFLPDGVQLPADARREEETERDRLDRVSEPESLLDEEEESKVEKKPTSTKK